MTQKAVSKSDVRLDKGLVFCDYEETYAAHKAEIVKEAPRSTALLRVPDDDIVQEARPVTVVPEFTVPSEAIVNSLPTPAREVLTTFLESAKNSQPTRKYQSFSKYPVVNVDATLSSIKNDLKYDIDVMDDDNTATAARPNVKNMFPDADKRKSHMNDLMFDAAAIESGASARLSNGKDFDQDFDAMQRNSLSSLFVNDESGSSSDEVVSKKRRLSVTLSSVSWQGSIETPLFGALLLYDCLAKQRISESAIVDFNSEAGLKHNFFFDVSSPHADIVLFVRLEKQFDGDLTTWLDSYAKGKAGDKPQDAPQPFGWTAVHLFVNDMLGEVADESIQTWETDWLYRYDETKMSDSDMITMCTSLRAKTPKKTIPVKLNFALHEVIANGPINAKQGRWMEEIPVDSAPYFPMPTSSLRATNSFFCWPTLLNIQKAIAGWKNITIKCQLAESDDPSNPTRFIKCFRSADGTMSDCYRLPINYHNRNPSFNDEIKIALPMIASANCHLLFTFSNVSFKHNRGFEEVGYSFLPLRSGTTFRANGEVSLPVALNLAPEYLKEDNGAVKWNESKKPIFTVDVRLSSCLAVQDSKLTKFFECCANASASETDIVTAVRDLADVGPKILAQFTSVVFDKLLEHICNGKSTAVVGKKCFRSLVSVIVAVSSERQGQAPVIVDYVNNRLHLKKAWTLKLHQELVSHWKSLIEEKEPLCKDIVRHSWVLFDLIWKSCVATRGTAKPDIISRAPLYGKDFLASLSSLLAELSLEIYRLSKGGLNIGNNLNENMAKFFVNCLAVLPVGSLFQKIRDHVLGFDESVAVQMYMKFDFLQVVCGYEHSIALSLPIKSVFNLEKPTSFWSSCRKFFFPSLLIDQVVSSIKHPIEKVRQKAFVCLNRVLAKIEADTRLTTFDRQTVFAMYLPFVVAACDNVQLLELEVSSDSLPRTADAAKQFTLNERKAFLISVGFVVQYMESKMLAKWVEKDSARSCAFYRLLYFLATTFQYLGKKTLNEIWLKGSSVVPKNSSDDAKKFIENSYKAGSSQTTNLRELRGTMRAQAAGSVKAVNKRNSETLKNRSHDASLSSTISIEATQEFKWAAMQAHETTLIVASALYGFTDTLKRHLLTGFLLDMEEIFSAVQALVCIPQNSVSASICIRLLALFIKELSPLVLKGNRLCSELCWSLLRAGSSPFSDARSYSADCMYMLMRMNFNETKKNFGKVKTQLTVALSKNDCVNPANLKISLLLVSKFAEGDAMQTKMFQKMCTDGVHALVEILKNNIKMNNCRDDPELLHDMYYTLAKSYGGAPDLRLTVLETLANLHVKSTNFAEAGFCTLNCAALVSEYLRFKGIQYGPSPMGSSQFVYCSTNISEESFFRGEVNPEQEGICQSTTFSEFGYLELLEKATGYFRKGNVHEVAVETMKLMLPVYEKHRNFNQLIKTHGTIKTCYEDIVNTMGKRILATFFKVDFYGKKFNDLDGKSFIYKERSVTQLSEIVTRLTDTYKMQYGSDFELLNDSAAVDRSKQDPNKVYIAIMFCEPFHTLEELKVKPTYFDRINGVTKFFYEVPYTLSGKARGEVEDQYKRKIIMKTDKPFPYIKKRLQVVATDKIELTPIEVSIEAIADRCEKLRNVVEAEPINLKNLQLLLQGSVRASVNKGPLEFAQIFLNAENGKKHNADKVKLLRNKFRDLLDWCLQALKLSKLHAPIDQAEYNEDLEEGYNFMKVKLDVYISQDQAAALATTSSPRIDLAALNATQLAAKRTSTASEASKIMESFLKS